MDTNISVFFRIYNSLLFAVMLLFNIWCVRAIDREHQILVEAAARHEDPEEELGDRHISKILIISFAIKRGVLSTISKSKSCIDWLQEKFGPSSQGFHLNMFFFETIETIMQLLFFLDVVALVPTTDWTTALLVLLTGYYAAVMLTFVETLRRKPWSAICLVAIDCCSDAWFLIYNIMIFGVIGE